jgi:hypothetical protein
LFKQIPKQHLKFVIYQNIVNGFLQQKLLALPIILSKQTLVSSSSPPFIFQNSPLYNHPKSHHDDPKQEEFKIQTNKVP